MVSFNVSPFVPLVILGSANPITRAPKRLAAVSNDKRVLMGAVASIDDGHVGDLGGVLRCTLDEVAHYDDVSVVRDHQNGVLQRLALRATGNLGVGKSYNSST